MKSPFVKRDQTGLVLNGRSCSQLPVFRQAMVMASFSFLNHPGTPEIPAGEASGEAQLKKSVAVMFHFNFESLSVVLYNADKNQVGHKTRFLKVSFLGTPR